MMRYPQLTFLLAACAGAYRTSGFAVRSRPMLSRVRHVGMSVDTDSLSWNDLSAASGDRAKTVKVLDALKAQGTAPLWDSINSNMIRPVSMGEVTSLTQIKDIAEAFSLQGNQAEFDELKNIFFIGTAVASVLALLSNALIPGIVGFTLTYVFALVPVFLLGIGSTAPGLLAAPGKFFAGQQSKEELQLRVARHEAAHLFMAYTAGLPIKSISIEDGETTAAVKLFDETVGMRTFTAEEAPKIAVVAMSGLMGECMYYGEARGGSEDLKQLQFILDRTTPRMQPRDQQGYTRYGAWQSWLTLKQNEDKYKALVDAVCEGKSVSECIQTLESA